MAWYRSHSLFFLYHRDLFSFPQDSRYDIAQVWRWLGWGSPVTCTKMIKQQVIVEFLGSLDLNFSNGGAAAPKYNKSTWVCCCPGTQGSSIFWEIASKGYLTGKQSSQESKLLIILTNSNFWIEVDLSRDWVKVQLWAYIWTTVLRVPMAKKNDFGIDPMPL